MTLSSVFSSLSVTPRHEIADAVGSKTANGRTFKNVLLSFIH